MTLFSKNRKRSYPRNRKFNFSMLERRCLLAGITFDAVTGIVNIEGSNQNDTVRVFELSPTLTQVEFLGFETAEISSADINLIEFFGHSGSDGFQNNTSIPSFAVGHRGDDIFSGGSGADRFFGGQGDDTIMGFQGDDELWGQDGNDTVIGGSGGDLISGGQGDDTLGGTSENDVIYGGDGNDKINGGSGNDRLFGHAGDDFISDTNGDDAIYGHQGRDRLFGQSGMDLIVGGDGNDFLSGGHGDDTIHGNDGEDQVTGGEGQDTIFGGHGDDHLEGDERGDTIFGGDGADLIDGGRGGLDILYGQNGNDTIMGGAGIGYNHLFGGNGNDTLQGGTSFDLIVGGNGSDFADGDFGNDEIYGGAGSDNLIGGPGDDLIAGLAGHDFIGLGQGNDIAWGGDGDDYIRGAAGDDELHGGNGNDRLYGMQGADSLFGDGGLDGLSGGPADINNPDNLNGGFGSDRFLLQGADNVIGFQNIDVVVFFRSAPESLVWAHGEIQAIDSGLQSLHLRTGNRNLLSDPISDRPIVIEKTDSLSPSLHIGRNLFDSVNQERILQFEEFDHRDESTNRLIGLELIREIGLSWASDLAIQSALPEQTNFFSHFELLSSWTSEPLDPNEFIQSDDGTQFYSLNANFADDPLSTRNSSEDFASIWRLTFEEGAPTAGLQSKLAIMDELFSLLS